MAPLCEIPIFPRGFEVWNCCIARASRGRNSGASSMT